MDITTTTNGDDNNTLINRLVLGLAAHPLNSSNPPPPELPDLLDSLITSEIRLEQQVTAIDSTAKGLLRRIQDLRKRLTDLRATNNHLIVQVNKPDRSYSCDFVAQCRIFEAIDHVLQKMCAQIMFIHATLTQKIREMTISSIKAHREIFAEFLGERHNHPGIVVADSSTLSCAPGCDWYQKHGPYEWSKKPYSDAWWSEMNQTDWDWLRMKEHFVAAVSVAAARVISTYQLLQANSLKFVPPWFWAENFETWSIHGELEGLENAQGEKEQRVVIKVQFKRTPAIQNQEKHGRLNERRKAGLHSQGKPGDDTEVVVDEVGEMVLDKTFVFDGLLPPSTSSQSSNAEVRWLAWWGFDKWHAEKKRAHQVLKTKDKQ